MATYVCSQCHARPAASGHPFCSKTCANAAGTGGGGSTTSQGSSVGIVGSVMNKLKGVTSGGSSNSPGNQNTAPVMYIPAPNQMQQTMQPMQMQQQQQQPQQMMIAQQPVMMMQQPQQAPQAMMMVSQPQPVQQHQPHQGHHHASMQVAVMIASPPPPQNCLYAGCTNKSYVDPSTGMPSKYCSKAHKQLAETCQFPNCGKPVYADPKTGKKGQFCSRSHAK
ncbi:hypothetical protein FRC15_007661 [Serendipita sp. 397]|nr:hypothetical protein FRC15_007661 [Serendipita sp. 397]